MGKERQEVGAVEGYIKDFIKKMGEVSTSLDPRNIFVDACSCFCLSLRGAITLDKNEKDRIEKEYQSYVSKYGEKGMRKIAEMFAIVVEALEYRRQDFLGKVYERLNATIKNFGQFFTPDSVSRMMARVVWGKPIEGKIITLNDPTCGAGALLIEGAEAFLEAGGRQGDLLIFAEDLDKTSCNIVYTQLSLLGYAAIVRHMDSLVRKVYDGPWYTVGFFAHAFPMRRSKWMPSKQSKEQEVSDTEAEPQQAIEVQDNKAKVEDIVPETAINVRELVQGELF